MTGPQAPSGANGGSTPTDSDEPRVYSTTPEEYAALRTHAALGDRSARSRGTFTGAKSADVLTGLVTSDVLALTPGHGSYAAALTPKGKIIADVRLFARAADFFVDVPPRAAEGWWGMVRKFVNPRLARHADVTHRTAELALLGPKSVDAMRRALGEGAGEAEALPLFGHFELATAHGPVTVARVPDFGVESYALWIAVEARDTVHQALLDGGARPVGGATLEVARMEAGRPEWGVEMDDSTIPQEANFDELQAISYTKGCYTGQETVARVHFRGHVNRQLRGLRFNVDEPLVVKAGLFDADDKQVGDVRSVAFSPRLGGIALAMVRREVSPDSELDVRWEGGDSTARVVELPFPHG